MTLKPASLQWSDDGSVESPVYGDVYFQRKSGPAESHYVFIEGNALPDRFKTGRHFSVAELGFGTGLNFIQTAKLFIETAPSDARLTFVSIEKHPILKSDLERIYGFWPEMTEISQQILDQYPPMIKGFHSLSLMNGRIKLILCFGDVAEILPQLSGRFDAWYLDGFTPAKNPEMWSEDIYPHIARLTGPGSTLATFSVAGHMRRALRELGFTVEKKKGFGIKWSMTTAKKGGTTPAFAPKKIAVLGAGIAGCSAARSLAERGHKVTITDRQEKEAAETSGNPIAVVYPKVTSDPSPLGDFHTAAFLYTRHILRVLKISSWQECGVLRMDMPAAAMIEKNGWPPEFAQASEGLFHPLAGIVSPPDFCRALLDHPNIERFFGTKAEKIPEDADAVIVALGHESKGFPETEWLQLQSLRGQITLARATHASAKLDRVICHEGYITPAIDGLHYLGATFDKEEPGDYAVRTEDHAENIEKLNQYLPQLGITMNHVEGGRTGYRTTTPDKLPLIGPCPDYADFLNVFADLRKGAEVTAEKKYITGLYVSTGYGAHGMTGAPFAGEIIAALVSDEPLPIPLSLLEYLMPERFIFRDLKRRKI